MRTVIHLPKEPQAPLPPSLAADDVRYPESLVQVFLDEFTQPGQLVLDPFAGYGTTLVVAEAMGRAAYGLELVEAKVHFARSRLREPARLIHGDARRLNAFDLPDFDFSITSPPYMSLLDLEDPLNAYQGPGKGYQAYLHGIQAVYAQVRDRMKAGARVVIEAANLKVNGVFTPLAWDLAREVSQVLRFEGEVVVDWEPTYGFGYDHSYCLVFAAS